MALWSFYDYIETTGRNPIRDWLDDLPPADCAKIDYRLRQMVIMSKWPEKWVSKYQGTDDIFEFRITGNKVQYRPLGTYYGTKQYLLLAGAIEKGNKIPTSDVESAKRRLATARKEPGHVTFHHYDADSDLEETEE
jgi:phage-related protein